jgi:hypothetical protein
VITAETARRCAGAQAMSTPGIGAYIAIIATSGVWPNLSPLSPPLASPHVVNEWVIVDLIGKGRQLRTVPVPSWSKQLLDAWLRRSGVSEGRVFRRVSKVGKRQEAGVTANVIWYAVKRCARQAGIANLTPTIFVARVPDSATIAPANSNRFGFCLGTPLSRQRSDTSGAKQKLQDAVNDRFGILVASETASNRKGRYPNPICG